MLKLAKGIKIPGRNDIPKSYNYDEIEKKRKNSRIEEGFTRYNITDKNYSDYFEVNIDNDKLWDLFCVLSDAVIPENCYAIFGIKDENPILSPYLTKKFIKSNYEEYKYSLVEDGYLYFGIASESADSFNEIFVESFKYIKIFTDKPDLVLELFKRFKIKNVHDLGFIDQLPVISLSLADADSGIKHSVNIVDDLTDKLKVKK